MAGALLIGTVATGAVLAGGTGAAHAEPLAQCVPDATAPDAVCVDVLQQVPTVSGTHYWNEGSVWLYQNGAPSTFVRAIQTNSNDGQNPGTSVQVVSNPASTQAGASQAQWPTSQTTWGYVGAGGHTVEGGQVVGSGIYGGTECQLLVQMDGSAIATQPCPAGLVIPQVPYLPDLGLFDSRPGT
jgi:hypothetical protein